MFPPYRHLPFTVFKGVGSRTDCNTELINMLLKELGYEVKQPELTDKKIVKVNNDETKPKGKKK
jgi:hypothetical protein